MNTHLDVQIDLPNTTHLLDETNYAIWSMRVKVYLKEVQLDVWNSVITNYTPPNKLRTTSHKDARKNNSMAMETILDIPT